MEPRCSHFRRWRRASFYREGLQEYPSSHPGGGPDTVEPSLLGPAPRRRSHTHAAQAPGLFGFERFRPAIHWFDQRAVLIVQELYLLPFLKERGLVLRRPALQAPAHHLFGNDGIGRRYDRVERVGIIRRERVAE